MAGDLSGVWHTLSPKTGWVSTLIEVESVLDCFYRRNDISFVSGKKYAEFGKNITPLKASSRIFFEDKSNLIPFDGVPFMFVSSASKECLFGRDKHHLAKKAKKEQRNKELMGDHPRPRKTRSSFQPSRKKGCTAIILIKEIVRFTDFKVEKNTEKLRKNLSRQIRQEDNVNLDRRFYISLPGQEDHTNHPVSQIIGFLNPIGKELRQKIFELVSSGVTSVSECKRHLRMFVEKEYSDLTPSRTNLAYYPLDETIRKHMYLSQQRLRYSQLDQQNVMHLVAKWTEENPEDRYLCIPSTSTTGGSQEDISEVPQADEDEVAVTITSLNNSFFFCHQTKYQRHLLQRCGKSANMIKEHSLVEIPKYLIIHLKRFRCNGTKEVRELPIPSMLRLRKYVSGDRELEDKLRLISFIHHEGTHVRGHYVAFIEHAMKWYEIDDMKIRGVPIENLKRSLNSSYILIFKTLPRPYID